MHFSRAAMFNTLIVALLLPVAQTRGEDPVAAPQRATMLAGFEKTAAESSASIARDPERVALYSQRGDAHLFLGHFAEAVADFEKMIALDPAQDAAHWRLGIAYYFAREFRKSAQQFEKYHRYDGRDRENGIWKFLADTKLHGLEKARGEMLVYKAFDREPFPALYEMFAGRKRGSDVFPELESKQLKGDRLVQFFAKYYVGLNEELLGHVDTALKNVREAVQLFSHSDLRGGPGYMWQVARLHYEQLAKSAKTE